MFPSITIHRHLDSLRIRESKLTIYKNADKAIIGHRNLSIYQPMAKIWPRILRGKIQSYLQAPLMEHDRQSDEICEGLPNGTSKRPAFSMCKEGTLVILHGGAITNMEGDDRYPVNFEKAVRVFLDVTSAASRRYDNLGLDVSLYKRSTGWFGCGWMFLPSFGMLNNYDLCQDNPSCPLSPGRQVLEFTLDPSRLFTRLFRMIHYDMVSLYFLFHNTIWLEAESFLDVTGGRVL
ncbi:hypothetical protein OSTOST_04231 [Ostertagia ostertagi]